MAHLHFKRTVYKSGGTQASAKVRYITRETEQEPAASGGLIQPHCHVNTFSKQ